MKILLVRNDNIGDLICTTPVIEALRKKYPNYQIDIVVNSYNYDAIHKNPFINNIYCYTKSKHKRILSEKLNAIIMKIQVFYKIWKEKYDAVVVLRRGYSKSAELFSTVSNAKYKIGVKNKNGNDNFNVYIELIENHHEVEFCFEGLKFFNVEMDNEKTRFYIPNKLKDKYSAFKNYICFHISARIKNNQLDYKKLFEILTLLKDKNIIITSEPKDYTLSNKLSENVGIKFIKTDSFVDLGGLFSNLSVLITLEGGAVHLGPAVDVKTIALFGQSDISRWYPWTNKIFAIQDSTRVANNINSEEVINVLNQVENI